MDTSKEYIRMCDCDEIFLPWEPIDGDLYMPTGEHYKERYHGSISMVGGSKQLKPEARKAKYFNSVWLPRQRQLQEMMLPKMLEDWKSSYALKNDPSFIWRMMIMRFEGWCNEFSPARSYKRLIFSSPEQLWLAFTMHQLHHKEWDGGEWATKNGEPK